MGRQSYRSRSTRGAEREFPGCMSGVLHLFDFNQAASSRKLLQETRFCEGLEAPRNSLDVPSGIMDFGRKSESNVGDIPFGFELPNKDVAKWNQEDAPRKSLKGSPMENEQKRRMPNVVARLMGLELMPDEPVSNDHSRRNSVSGRQFLSIFIDKEHKQEQKASKVQSVKISQNANRSQIFRVHPQEKQLEEFKREFEAYEIQQHRDFPQYLQSKKHNNVTSAARRYHDQKFSRENVTPENTRQSSRQKARKHLEELEFLHKNKENVESVLEYRPSLQRKLAEPQEKVPSRCAESTMVQNRSVFRCRSKPPLVDEVAPFRASRNNNKAKILSPNNNARNLGSSLASKRTLLRPPSETARVAKPSYTGSLPHQCSRNDSKQNINSNKTSRLSKDVINPKQIATEIVKHAKESATAKASEKITANQDFGSSASASISRRRNLRRVDSIGIVEADSPSTLKRFSNHSGKSSPRMVNSPRRNDHDLLKYSNCSQSKPNSPRLGDSSPRSKFKSDDRSSVDRAKGGQDFSIDSPRMLSKSHSLPTAQRYLHARPSSSHCHGTNQKMVSEDYSALKAKGASIPVIKTKNKNITKEFLQQTESANLATCDLEVRSEVMSDSTACPRHSQTERPEYANVFNYHAISSPTCEELSSVPRCDEDQAPELGYEVLSSIDKTLSRPSKWARGEVRYSISDGKCEHLSPVSVLGGLFQEESVSSVDIKETSPDQHELRDNLFVIELETENLPESKQEGKVCYQPKYIAGDKVSNSAGNVERFSMNHIICPDESKSDLVYVRDILCFAGFRSSSIVAFTAWYSPAHPINPDIYNQLEIYYSNRKRTARIPTQKLSSQRRLLFELVDEILCKKVKPFLNIRPWINPKKLYRCYNSTGEQLLEELWSEICSFPQADCKIVEDVNALVNRDLANIEECQMASHEDVEKIGFEVEQHIFKSLIEEAVADFAFSL